MIHDMNIKWAAEPKSYSSTAVTKKWISLAGHGKVIIGIITGAWASGATAAVTLKQATNTSGGSAKALSFSTQYNDVASSGTLVETAVTSNTFNLTTANKIHEIEVDASELDGANGFTCLSLDVASPGANACFYGAFYIMGESRKSPSLT